MVELINEVDEYSLTYIANNLRKLDQDELEAATGRDPAVVLRDAVNISSYVRLAMKDDLPMALIGLALSGDTGIPWMLGTDDLTDCSREFLTMGREVVDEMQEITPFLTNMVDVRNKPAIRLLKHLGFKFSETIDTYGHAELPFVQFYRGKYV